MDFTKLKSLKKLAALHHSRLFGGVCSSTYEDVQIPLNPKKINYRRRISMLAPRIKVFKTTVNVHSLCKPVILRIAIRIKKKFARNVSPSARCVSARHPIFKNSLMHL
jgi:hypothetical protein